MEIADVRIIAQPDAMDMLMYWHRQLRREHPNWYEYRERMVDEQQVSMRINIEAVGPNRRG
jgi:hypothetical protein